MAHHHHGERPHPSPALSASLLRLSVAQRITFACILIAVIWAAAFWAVS